MIYITLLKTNSVRRTLGLRVTLNWNILQCKNSYNNQIRFYMNRRTFSLIVTSIIRTFALNLYQLLSTLLSVYY